MKCNPLVMVFVMLGLLAGTAYASYSLAQDATLVDLVNRGLINSDVAASIGLSVLESDAKETEELSEAELLYGRAKQASEEGEWLSVKALLEDSPAIERVDYEQYASALLLLTEAVDKVSGIEAQVADELQSLRDEAQKEQDARAVAESAQAQTAAELSSTKQQKDAQEAALLKKISESEEEKQAAIKKAQEEENTAFINELDVYVQLMNRANNSLVSTEVEIDAGRDAQALVFIKQSEDLLDQVEGGGEELRDNRTPSEFASNSADLLRAVGVYLSSAKHYRGMVAQFPDQGDAYQDSKSAAIAARLDGKAIINDLAEVVALERSGS